MNKKGLEMSFSWIFAIVVGAIILFGAIYFATQFINNSQHEINTKTAKEFTNLLNPMLTSAEESKMGKIELISDTRVYTSCEEYGNFGNSVVQISEKTGNIGGENWPRPGGDIKVQNSYMFAESIIEGKKFNFFTERFEMPFKVSDIIIVYSQKYCLVNSPESVENEIRGLGIEEDNDIQTTNSLGDCSEGSVKVCFESGKCDINIMCNDYECDEGIVKKDGKEVYFVGKLVYGAIFSDVDVYECNVKRIMKRTSYLAKVYSDKARIVSETGCNTNLAGEMESFSEITKNYKELSELSMIKARADEINSENENRICQLY